MVDNLIRLYSQRPTDPTSSEHSVGILSDAISCNVVEERNSVFEFHMTYPLNGNKYNEILPGRYVKCKPNAYDNPQLFKIVDVRKNINGEATITGYHVSYNLIDFVIGGIKIGKGATTIKPDDLWGYLRQGHNIYPESNLYFTFDSDMGPSPYWLGWNLDAGFMNLREFIGGDGDNSILKIWPDGEFKFDNYDIYFLQARGQDRNVTIRYGKNMTDLNHTINDADVYDGVFPFWKKEDMSVRLKPSSSNPTYPIIWRDSTKTDNERVFLLDLSDRWDDKPTQSQLVSAATAWLQNTDYINPKVQITVSFFNLSDAVIRSDEGNYHITPEEIEQLSAVKLCDIVSVYHPDARIFIKTKVVKTDYNVLTGHYNSIDLGEVAASLATAFSGLSGGSSSTINVDATKVVRDNLYQITEVNWKSNTQFEVKAKSTYRSTDAEESESTEEVINVFNISTSGNNVIFTNATSGETITFKDWPS